MIVDLSLAWIVFVALFLKSTSEFGLKVVLLEKFTL